MIKVTIMNETGHTELSLDSSGVLDQIQEHSDYWIFVDGEMKSRATVNEIEWDSVESVTLVPALQGGSL